MYITESNSDLSLNKKLINTYYQCLENTLYGCVRDLEWFKNNFPNDFKRINSIHIKRSEIRKCYESMKTVSEKVYFGTLTFNVKKDLNKVTSKRKEAFTKLGKLFEYFLIVEEYGETNTRRYHIHFIGTLKFGKSFDDFRKVWRHSRQNLELVRNSKKACSYLAKYSSKQAPRLRRNKALVRLEKAYKAGKHMEHAGFKSLGAQYQCAKAHAITIFDLES